ncbi:MAG TPA: cobalamin biosynthesis protein [Thiothrix sp.]|nr:cobalamin biosynthesis protein [Thiothrix sp.]
MTFTLHSAASLIAVWIDRLVGEPRRFHPLIAFGHYANYLEKRLNRGTIWQGVLAWSLAVLPFVLLVYGLQFILTQWFGAGWVELILSSFFAWLAIGWQSLREHAQAVQQALTQSSLDQARTKVSYLVSRDTQSLDETGVSRACIESTLENGSDAVIAPLFFVLIGGAPAVVAYRLCNTLDAMWGYRNPRFERFGKWSARCDDVLNYLPARLTATLYTSVGQSKTAWFAWQQQAKTWYSPNAGVVMASGAGALNIQLGGTAIYHQQQKSRPILGTQPAPNAKDIQRAIRLLDHSVFAYLCTLMISVILAWISYRLLY